MSENDSDKYQYVHSTYVDVGPDRHYIINAKNVETGESRLDYRVNLTRKYCITKPQYRNHIYKKEFAPEHEVETYSCTDQDLYSEIAHKLNIRLNKYNRRSVLNSPYVYGADIDMEVLIKMRYRSVCKRPIKGLGIGGIDIEQSVLGDDRINVMSYIDGKTRSVYTAIHKDFLKEKTEGDIRVILEDVKRQYREKLKAKALAIWDEQEFTYKFLITDSELELIEWTFARMHEHKPDFVGIWNIGYDMIQIAKRLEILGVDPADVFCHPDVPPHLRRYVFDTDGKNHPHIVDAWHHVKITGYTQFIDVMCLYGRLRRVNGREISYTLDYIMGKELGAGKVKFGESKTHYVQQTTQFDRYVVYNIFDTLLMVLLEFQNKDINNMLDILDNSLIQHFSKQMDMLKNNFYKYCRDNQCVSAAIGGDVSTPWDNLLANEGGAVLDPRLARGTGVPVVEEFSGVTWLNKFVTDIDVRSMYPNLIIAFNIAKETKLATVLAICDTTLKDLDALYKKDVADKFKNKYLRQHFRDTTEDFFVNVSASKENAVYIANKFFGIPNHKEMLELYLQSKK